MIAFQMFFTFGFAMSIEAHSLPHRITTCSVVMSEA